MTIILYSNNCPRCEHLESLLKAEGIPYEHITDTDLMLSLGFTTVPMLAVDGQVMDHPAALAWLKERRNEPYENHQV